MHHCPGPLLTRFYFHEATKETTWDRPVVEEGGGDTSLPEDWVERVDTATGKTFYFNKVTHTTAFERPHAQTRVPVSSKKKMRANIFAESVGDQKYTHVVHAKSKDSADLIRTVLAKR